MSEPEESDPIIEVCKEFDRLNKEIASLRQDRDRLRQALERYGRHLPRCATRLEASGGLGGEDWSLKKTPCTCGLDAALKGEPNG